jgi:hypothetical protein
MLAGAVLMASSLMTAGGLAALFMKVSRVQTR